MAHYGNVVYGEDEEETDEEEEDYEMDASGFVNPYLSHTTPVVAAAPHIASTRAVLPAPVVAASPAAQGEATRRDPDAREPAEANQPKSTSGSVVRGEDDEEEVEEDEAAVDEKAPSPSPASSSASAPASASSSTPASRRVRVRSVQKPQSRQIQRPSSKRGKALLKANGAFQAAIVGTISHKLEYVDKELGGALEQLDKDIVVIQDISYLIRRGNVALEELHQLTAKTPTLLACVRI